MSDDPIDVLAEQWRRARPDLDPAPMALVGRLLRAARATDRAVGAELARHDLQPGWFDVLSALRRSGAPHRLTPGALATAVMLSTGGMTKRLDQMETAGLLTRSPDPRDRRGLLIALTAKGRRLVDNAVEAHVRNEEQLLSGLSAAERSRLEALLRKLEASVAAASQYSRP
jgi:DNA-binding MarR family transcriptional regulator